MPSPVRPLNICVYASSSRNSSESAKASARALGELLAERGHLCINGGGQFGCMGSLNDGVFSVAGGRLLVVIHEMWCSGTERK